MAYSGTRETASWWKNTSVSKLIKAEKAAWEVASQNLNYLDSYFIPIEFDQRYPVVETPTFMEKEQEQTNSEWEYDFEANALLDTDIEKSNSEKLKSNSIGCKWFWSKLIWVLIN